MRAGSSARTVPDPTSTASTRFRSRCTSARAASPVTQRLSPDAVASLPSSDTAALSVTQGRPARIALKKGRFSASVSPASTPVHTGIPSPRSRRTPRPSTRGFGSADPANTRATPAARMASVQGGVRPW